MPEPTEDKTVEGEPKDPSRFDDWSPKTVKVKKPKKPKTP